MAKMLSPEELQKMQELEQQQSGEIEILESTQTTQITEDINATQTMHSTQDMNATLNVQAITHGVQEIPAQPVNVVNVQQEPVLSRKQKRKQKKEIKKLHPTLATVESLRLRERMLNVPKEGPFETAELEKQNARSVFKTMIYDNSMLTPSRFTKAGFLADIETLTKQYRQCKDLNNAINIAQFSEVEGLDSDLAHKRAEMFIKLYEVSCMRFGIKADGAGVNKELTGEMIEKKFNNVTDEANITTCQLMGSLANKIRPSQSHYFEVDKQIAGDYQTGQSLLEKNPQDFARWGEQNPEAFENYMIAKRLQASHFSITNGSKITEAIFRAFGSSTYTYQGMDMSLTEYKQWLSNLAATPETAGSSELAKERNIAGLKTYKEILRTHYSLIVQKYGNRFERDDGFSSMEEFARSFNEIRNELKVNGQVEDNLNINVPEMWENTEEDQTLRDLILYYHNTYSSIPALQLVDKNEAKDFPAFRAKFATFFNTHDGINETRERLRSRGFFG